MIEQVLAGLAATTAAEAVSVLLGIVYALLAVRQNRYCWIAGGLSSAILVYLSAQALLPMQAVLQSYYVLIAIYGYWRWSRASTGAAGDNQISVWPAAYHLLAVALIAAAALFFAEKLVSVTPAAWPHLDIATTLASLLASWFVTQMKLENWLYWIVIDLLSVVMYAAQGLMFVAFLYVAFLCIACVGFFTWLKRYRLQSLPA
ncbi:MAG: nicotinamide riboside transporter PnuC [Steroidobacteraceae bacterium]